MKRTLQEANTSISSGAIVAAMLLERSPIFGDDLIGQAAAVVG
jgi:hypothetical protein